MFATLALPGAVHGQGAAPGPTIPLGMDLGKAPLGAWSEYTVKVADMPPFKQRFALVARAGGAHEVEMITEGGVLGQSAAGGRAGRVTMKVVFDADTARADRVKKVVMQLGDNEPMDMAKEAAATANQFRALDPKKLVGRKSVKVAGGQFDTRHYREKSPAGHTVDVWISDQAPPFGVVKLQGSFARGGEQAYPLVMELAARGGDARAVITRAARPFDPAVLMSQMNKTLSGGGQPAPAPAPAPSPPASKPR